MKAFRAVDETLFLAIEKEVVGMVARATEFNQQGRSSLNMVACSATQMRMHDGLLHASALRLLLMSLLRLAATSWCPSNKCLVNLNHAQLLAQ